MVRVVASIVKPKTQKKKSQAPAIAASKKNSFSGKPYNKPSAKELDAHQRSKAGKGGYKTEDLKKFNQKKKYNEKIQKSRNSSFRASYNAFLSVPTSLPIAMPLL